MVLYELGQSYQIKVSERPRRLINSPQRRSRLHHRLPYLDPHFPPLYISHRWDLENYSSSAEDISERLQHDLNEILDWDSSKRITELGKVCKALREGVSGQKVRRTSRSTV